VLIEKHMKEEGTF